MVDGGAGGTPVSSTFLDRPGRPIIGQMTTVLSRTRRGARPPAGDRSAAVTLLASAIGFFVITLDAVIVNVALPSMADELGGGVAGLQWVVDGYTLMFAGMLLSAGVLSDRLGAKRAFGGGMALFVLASAACGWAPDLASLVVARFVQGGAAAVMMPSSMALLSEAYPDPRLKARAVGMWAMGAAVASSSGPLLGGLLTLASWRLIFAINVPIGLLTFGLVSRIERSPVRAARFDPHGLVLALAAMGSLTFGAIEAGTVGLTDGRVLTALAVALVAGAGFVFSQRRAAAPMVPPELARNREVIVASIVGFAFIVGYYGLPFVMSLFLQQQRGLSSFQTGLVFLPMMVVGAVLVPFSAGAAERLGPRRLVTGGLVLMTTGLSATALAPVSSPIWVWSALMAVVGLAGPAIMPPTTALLLGRVPAGQAGTAGGIFNTSRQLGGALAVAVFGALLANTAFHDGMRVSLLLAAAVAAAAAVAGRSVARRSNRS